MNRKEKRGIYFGPYPCESGKKYKKCCFLKDLKEREKQISKTEKGEQNV